MADPTADGSTAEPQSRRQFFGVLSRAFLGLWGLGLAGGRQNEHRPSRPHDHLFNEVALHSRHLVRIGSRHQNGIGAAPKGDDVIGDQRRAGIDHVKIEAQPLALHRLLEAGAHLCEIVLEIGAVALEHLGSGVSADGEAPGDQLASSRSVWASVGPAVSSGVACTTALR